MTRVLQGQYEIDKGHPLFRGASTKSIVWVGNTPNIELNSKRSTPIFNGASFTRAELLIDSNDGYLLIREADLLANKTEFTMMVSLKYSGTGLDILSNWGPNIANQQFLFNLASDRFSIAIQHNGSYWGRHCDTTLPVSGEEYTIVISWKAPNVLSVVINGVVQTLSVWFNDRVNSILDSAIKEYQLGKSITTSNAVHGGYYLTVVTDKAINNDLSKALSLDPYQILKLVRTVKSVVYAAIFGAPPTPSDDRIQIGNLSVDAMKLGSSNVDKVILGTDQVYP